MAETDDILLAALRSIGVEPPDGATSVGQFDSSTVVTACARCLNAINDAQGEDARYAEKLPGNPGARFRLCTTLAEAVGALGFTSELGFNNFLYPEEAGTRKLLLFLVDAMPKADGGGEEAAVGGGGGIAEQVHQALARWSDRLWVPPAWQQRRSLDEERAARLRGVMRQSAAAAAAEARRQEELEAGFLGDSGGDAVAQAGEAAAFAETAAVAAAAAAAVEARERATTREGRLGHLAAFMQEEETGRGPEDMKGPAEEVETAVQRAERLEREKLQAAHTELEEAQEALTTQRNEVASAEAECAALVEQGEALSADAERGAKEVQQAQQATEVLARSVALATDPEAHRATLEQNAAKLEADLAALREEWETHRAPLADAIAAHEEKASARKAEAGQKLTAARQLRSEMAAMATQLQERDEAGRKLEAELHKLQSGKNPPLRSSYTKRIMEIVKNVRKQAIEIEKILRDVKQLQKEINSTSDSLQRTFATCDEVIFRSATKDEGSKRCYKGLAYLHEAFGNLVSSSQEIGAVAITQRQLRGKVDELAARNRAEAIEQISGDLKQLRIQNDAQEKGGQ